MSIGINKQVQDSYYHTTSAMPAQYMLTSCVCLSICPSVCCMPVLGSRK